MYYLSFSISSNCGLSAAAEHLQNKIVTLNVINSTDFNTVIAFTLARDIDAMRNDFAKDFKTVYIARGKKAAFINGTKISHGIVPAMISEQIIPLYPIFAENGSEWFNAIVLEKEHIDNFVALIEKKNNIETLDYERIRNGDSMFSIIKNANRGIFTLELTETERRIVNSSLRQGFFSWPRSYDLTSISREFGLTKPTILYHIRNAERKVMEALFGS